MCNDRAVPNYTFRLSEEEVAQMDALANDQGLAHRVDLLRRAVGEFYARHGADNLEAALIDDLCHDFLTATFQLGRDEQGAPTVAVVDVDRRTTDPLGRPYSATNAPLTQFVNVEARAAEPGRTTIELVGLPGTDHAGVRVWIATLPSTPPPGSGTRPGPTVTVALMDVHPLARQRVHTDPSTEGETTHD